jgi:predicted nucleic acid-binding protein
VQILVDSSVWIDYFKGTVRPETDYLDSLIGDAALLVADAVMEEVFRGLQDETERRQAWDVLIRFWLIEVRGVHLAWQTAVNCQKLRARGIEVRPSQCRLATFCLQEGFALLHSSTGYEPFEKLLGLTVARPEKPTAS